MGDRCQRWRTTAGFAMVMGMAGVTGHTVSAQQRVAAETTDRSIETRRVTLSVSKTPLLTALQLIAKEAALNPAFNESIIPPGAKVTLDLKDTPVSDAFEAALRGTGLVASIRPSGYVAIARAGAMQAAGRIEGVVRDPANAPIANARVVIRGTAKAGETNAAGVFQFGGLQAGKYVVVVSRLGFMPVDRTVTLAGNDTLRLAFTLKSAPTRLTEVVTTATGQEERRKIGNDVGTINADSLVQNTLVRSLSDLLTGHVAGVQATPSGGAVGAPTKIRVRGVTSPQLNNDPIVVIDGVRVQAQTTANTLKYQGVQVTASQVNTGPVTFGRTSTPTALAPSAIDQIDPNMIESIDILRGPTATALYGPDASTGVIVVKTKRAQAGPWRYHVGGDYGWTVPLSKYPLRYTGWGQPQGGGPSTPGCPLQTFSVANRSQANGGCTLDSVTAFNPQNDPLMTNLATATNQSIVMDASGGGQTVQGFLQGDYGNSVGQQKLSEVEQRRLARMWTTPVPSWMIRPNAQVNAHVTSKVQAVFSPAFDISATGTGTYQTTRNDGTGLSGTTTPLGPGDTLTFLPAENLRGRATTSTKRGGAVGSGRFQPVSWLVFNGSGGIDYSMRDDQSLTRSLDCTLALNPNGCANANTSLHAATRTEVLVPSFNMGATFTYNLTHWLSAHTAFGESYSKTQSYAIGISANNLSFGSEVITGASQINPPTEATDASATAGWYAEQQVGINGRLFFTAAFRRDASSSFGGNTVTPTFPKYGVSWVVSEEPFFPRQRFLTEVRLRTAYGESGKQGSQADVLPNYAFGSGYAGTASVPILIYSGVGNSRLEPQRDGEWEGGVDLNFFDNRATVGATWYRKKSDNAIASINLPPSPGNVVPLQSANVGDIRNTGWELSLAFRPLDTKFLTWDFNVSASANHNKLVSTNNTVLYPTQNGTRMVAGYPLFGLWQRPILTYDDHNGNGILEYNEIVFADSAVFIGSTDPKGSYNYANSFTMMGGRLRVSSLISQVNGLTTALSAGAPRASIDKRTSLAEQAAYLQASGTPLNSSPGGYIGTVNYVNFGELSALYTLPASFARRLRATSSTFTIAARNIAKWSNYRGADPTTNTSVLGGDETGDNGLGLAQPRSWVARLNFQF